MTIREYFCIFVKINHTMEAKFIKGIVYHHRKKLLLTYFLVLLEKIGELSIPFFLGISIDGLVNHNFMPLIYLGSIYLIWVLIGTIRHRYDTKTYTNIYNQIVIDIIDKDKEQNVSKTCAHTNLIREIIDFMEFDKVYITTAIINIIGSMIMIWMYSTSVVLLCSMIMIPVIYLSKSYGSIMKILSHRRNSELEKQVDVISTGNINATKSHFSMLRLIQIRISDKEATNYWQLQVISLILLIGSLLVIGLNGPVKAGILVAMWSYLLTFLGALEIIPYAIQKWSNLHDIVSRIQS